MNSRKRDFNRAIGWAFVAVVGAAFWLAVGFGLGSLLG